MSKLRKRLKQPETYLATLALLVALGLFDSCRRPENQITAHLYIGAVHLYQAVGRPLLQGRIQCRYDPTCSEYSVQAVARHGIRRGLVLTVRRINSCTAAVPLGTAAPVP